MDILFWNLHKSLPVAKLNWLTPTIQALVPDILCFAEGPTSIESCLEFVEYVEKFGYVNYYDPTIYKESTILEQYGWNQYGLKIFIRKGVKTLNNFTFSDQKMDGRIIYLRFKLDKNYYSVFFLHSKSKAGEQINQVDFIAELSSFIRFKTLTFDSEKIVLVGDFNIEPWDNLLKKPAYIFSLFYKKQFNFYSSSNNLERIYYNPVFEYIQNHIGENVIGTYYKGEYIAILDFALFSKNVDNYSFEIITEISGTKLIEKVNSKYKLVGGFDHLPIMLKLM